MPQLHWTEVDGVPTVWVDSPSPLIANLVFRTGRVDETLVTSGWTHLVEHLAMWQFRDSSLSANGGVAGAHTSFTVSGKPEEVQRFLTDICCGLTCLPGERLEDEKKVLLAEEATRPAHLAGSLLLTRYGARGYGQMGLRELGSRTASLDQLQALSRERFCRENAFLWLTGPPPAGLRLDLPSGTKRPLPPLVSVLEESPCWFVEDELGGIALGATVPRVSASSVFRVACEKALVGQLRHEQAVSYAPTVGYDYLSGETAHLTLFGDSDAERRGELAEVFMQVVERLADFSEAEVKAAKKELLDQWAGSSAPPADVRAIGEVQRAAMSWICGRDFETMGMILAGAMQVKLAEVQDFGRAVQEQAVFALPGGIALTPEMGVRAGVSRGSKVKGRKASLVDSPVHLEKLVYGQEGVSILSPDKTHATVRYSDLEAAVVNTDGRVSLISSDGIAVTVEPTLWRRGAHACSDIRERIPSGLVLDQGPRSPENIPMPYTTRWQRFRAFMNHRPEVIFGGFMIGLLVAFLLLTRAGDADDVNISVFIGPLVIILVLWAARAWRRR